MQAPSSESKPKTFIIDANDWSTRTIMRMALITMPFWLIVGPISTWVTIESAISNPKSHVNFPFNEQAFFYWAPVLCVLGLLAALLTTTNKVVVRGSKIFLPAFFFKSIQASDIQSLSVHQKRPKYFLISFDLKSGQRLQLSPGRLDGNRLNTLVEAVKQHAPGCEVKISENDINDLRNLGFKFDVPKSMARPSAKIEADGSIELEYRPHAKYQQLLDAITAHEKYFWRAWLSLILIPLIAASPYLLYWFITRGTGETPVWLETLGSFYSWILNCIGSGIGMFGGTYFNLATNLYIVPVLMFVCFVLIGKFFAFVFQPNRLAISPTALKLGFEAAVTRKRGWRIYEHELPWKDVKSVQLKKPRGSTSVDQWSIAVIPLPGCSSTAVQVNLSALADEKDRRALVQAIQRYAPQATCDAELLEALQPAQKRSYTELWLQSLATPPRRNRLAPLEAHQVLNDGRYTVEHRLGVGGQGVAYLATATLESGPGFSQSAAFRLEQGDSSLGSDKVVLKEFIMPVYVDKNVRRQAVEKFEHEATILQKLDHRQVVKMMDYFIEDHRGYLVLEHIDGFSLQQMIENGKVFSEDEVIDLALQMCDILQYLHSLSPPVVHRDFTPDNLILNTSGVLKLIDFNVAQQRESTATGTVVGKHAYIPPEQFRGKPSPQSDFYAMGATLFFLLTGKDPEPLRQCHPAKERNLSDGLNSVVACCTNLDTSNRYHEVSQIVASLHALRDTESRETSTALSQPVSAGGSIPSIQGPPEVSAEIAETGSTHVIYMRQAEEQHG